MSETSITWTKDTSCLREGEYFWYRERLTCCSYGSGRPGPGELMRLVVQDGELVAEDVGGDYLRDLPKLPGEWWPEPVRAPE